MERQRQVLTVPALVVSIVLSLIPARAQVSFAPAQDYPLSSVPYQVIVGDFNGDGNPDLAAVSIYSGSVSVLVNNGNGTFGSPQTSSAITPDPNGPSGFSSLATGDFNGDGRLDVVVAHGNEIAVLLGNGDGTLRDPVVNNLSFTAFNFFGVGDFNHDGKADVAVYGADSEARELILLLGNGDATFSRGISPQSGQGLVPQAGLVADFNHDGKMDTLFASGSDLWVFLGNGDGTFQPALTVTTSAPAINLLTTGDFEHDAELDVLATAVHVPRVCGWGGCHGGTPGGLTFLLGKGDGSFAGQAISSSDFALPIIGDFDGDGNLDFGVANLTSSTFDFYWGDGHGKFGAPSALPMVAAIAAADLDADGLTDLVLRGSSSSVQVALNSTPTFSLTASAPGPPIHAGNTAVYTITVGQQHEFKGTVELSCSAPESAGIRCSLSPSSLSPGTDATLTVTTTGNSAALLPRQAPTRWLYGACLPFGAIVFSAIGFGRRRDRKEGLAFTTLGCMLLVGMVFLVACGGGGPLQPSGTPPGNYTITVMGSSGATQHSTSVSLTVQ
jgi:VCBS repeat protein